MAYGQSHSCSAPWEARERSTVEEDSESLGLESVNFLYLQVGGRCDSYVGNLYTAQTARYCAPIFHRVFAAQPGCMPRRAN